MNNLHPDTLSLLAPNPDAIPPRFRESAFREYEPYIARIAQRYPRRVYFAPGMRSTETFSCRLRDAMTSFVTHAWPSTQINYQTFKQIHPSLKVGIRRVDNNYVIIVGTKDALRDVTPAQVEEVSAPGDVFVFPDVINHVDHLKFLCALAASRVITRRVQLTITDRNWIQKMYDLYDVDFEEQNDGTWIML